jgi:hypothetical protein
MGKYLTPYGFVNGHVSCTVPLPTKGEGLAYINAPGVGQKRDLEFGTVVYHLVRFEPTCVACLRACVLACLRAWKLSTQSTCN